MKHIVDFKTFCDICKYKDLKEEDEPCCDCLENPANEDSRRPVYFKEEDS